MDKRNRLKIFAIIIFIFTAGTIYSCTSPKNNEIEVLLQNHEVTESTDPELAADQIKKTNNISQEEKDKLDNTATTVIQNQDTCIEYIYVHLCGAVKNPDVYKVESDARLIDVISLAGGLADDAAGDHVNQAATLTDGQQVYIPFLHEVKDITPYEFQKSTTLVDSKDKNNQYTSSLMININQASMEELMSLPGIGEAKAKSIIEYREKHKGFQSIEEIKNIAGIKDSVYNKIKDFITVK